MPLMKLESVSLSAANVTEKMIQGQIADDPVVGQFAAGDFGVIPRM